MPRRYYSRYYSSYYGSYYASQHISQRESLSMALGGIDEDVERIFLNLPPAKLQSIFRSYGRQYSSSALSYARQTYPLWKSGTVRMSGKVAERLLNLVPPVLDASTRFDLVKKLRFAHMRKERKYVTCQPANWREVLAPLVAELIAASHQFQLPEAAVKRVRWLANGDTGAAQRLLAAAEQEEAVGRLRYLEAEFERIDFLLRNIESTRAVNHTIELPQGTIVISIALPRKGLRGWLNKLLS